MLKHFDFRRGLVLMALGAFAFLGAFGARVWTSQEIQAEIFPGIVLQTGSASGNGLVVDIERATFSAAAVDVDLLVRIEDPGVTTAGISPADAEMNGEQGLSARIRTDGRTSLRFPAAAWPETGKTAILEINAVQVVGSSGINLVNTELRFVVQLPQGDEAAKAREISAFQPAVVQVHDQEMTVQAFRAHSTLLVQYSLPVGVLAPAPPALRAGDIAFDVEQSLEDEGVTQIWYQVGDQEGPLVLRFEGWRVPDPSSSGWHLDVGLDAFAPPAPTANNESLEEYELEWIRQPGSDGPAVVGVAWWRFQEDVRLRLTIDGLWEPGPQADGSLVSPVVYGGGGVLKVIGFGVNHATSERGAITVISISLDDPNPPRQLSVSVGGETVSLPPIQLSLQP